MKRLNREELNKLPQEVVKQVEGTLKAYNSVGITFENGKYNVSPGTMIKNSYADDFKVIGDVYADDIYNTDDKVVNYIEQFMCYPVEYKGNKDWTMIKKLEELRGSRKAGKIALDDNGNAFITEIVDLY